MQIGPQRIEVNAMPEQRDWRARIAGHLHLSLMAAYVLMIWTVEYFPSQDGPCHVDNGSILARYHAPESELLREYYQINAMAVPNWLTTVVLAVFLQFALPATAEKLLLTAYILGLTMSLRFAFGSARVESKDLAVAGFPLVLNLFLHLGFYNFCISLALFCFIAGYWIRHANSLSGSRAVCLALSLVALYFCHPVSLVMALVFILSMRLQDPVRRRLEAGRSVRPAAGARTLQWRPLVSLLAIGPAVFILGAFLLSHGGPSLNLVANVSLVRPGHFLMLYAFGPAEIWLSALYLLFLAALGVLAMRTPSAAAQSLPSSALLGGVVVFSLVYLAAPNSIGGGHGLKRRLVVHLVLVSLFWLGSKPWSPRARRWILGCAVLLCLAQLGLYRVKYAELNRDIREYVSAAPWLTEDSTLLPLAFENQGTSLDGHPLSSRARPFLHLAGYLTASRRIVNLGNYEAQNLEEIEAGSSARGNFPILFRAHLDPYIHIGPDSSMEAEPPQARFLDYADRTGGRVDYVLLWDLHEEVRTGHAARDILAQLRSGYERIYVSQPRGLLQLYRRSGLSTVGPVEPR